MSINPRNVNPRVRRSCNWRRSTARAVVLGAFAAVAFAPAALAVPSEPDPFELCYPYPDSPGVPCDPPGGGDAPNDADGGSSGDSGSWDQDLGFDVLKIPGPGIDFGDNTFLAGTPVGFGSVQWGIDGGFYSARLVGTLHLDGVDDQFGRMHVSYWWGGEMVATRHGGTVRAPDDDHHRWSVDLAPYIGSHVDEVHVCTEISDDGVDFDTVDCKTRYI